MANYLQRLIFIDAEHKHTVNPLSYPFMFASFFYGLGFATLGWWSGVNTSSLFTAMFDLHHFLPELWGSFAILAAVLAVSVTLFRRPAIGKNAAMLGFLVWLFALIIYGFNGFWLVLLTVAAPNLYYWVWFYFRVKWFERAKKEGTHTDP